MEYLASLYGKLEAEIRGAIVGHDEVLLELMVAFAAGGHVLLEGPPGTGKTLLARTLSQSLDLQFRRIQFTPDLMPADVLGTSIFHTARQEFEFRPGPIFTDVLLGDEINRTPPKTQSALLEAMEERQVTIDGQAHPLSESFFVIATQNPIEYEGTYPLPEAQIDRFFMKILVPYPDDAAEIEILRRHMSGGIASQPANRHPISRAEIVACLQRVEVSEEVLGYVAAILRRTREDERILLGASPRAGVALGWGARALASLEGRGFVTPDDVKRLTPPVIRHRLVLRPESEMEGLGPDAMIQELLDSVPVPR